MGYCADTVENNFTILASKVPAALAAANDEVKKYGPYQSLSDFVEDLTSFQDCAEDDENGFALGYHCDKVMSEFDAVLELLGRFATEGSYVRMRGEDDYLFGYRVVDGRLRTETGDWTWRLDPERTAVSKTVITVTVLHSTQQPLPLALDAVVEEFTTGNAVGAETRRETTMVPDESVGDELRAVGNDGKFFDTALDLAER